MPRKRRIDFRDAIQHVLIRGIERTPIFQDGDDRQEFVDRLESVLKETRTDCYAWALLNDHVHLIVRTGRLPLAVAMGRLLTGYALYFNRRYNRTGRLFYRYRSVLIEEERYLLDLVRYIHLNPVRVGPCKNTRILSKYRWTGHSALVGKRIRRWQDTAYILRFFDEKVLKARAEYAWFVQKGVLMGRRPDLVGGSVQRSVDGRYTVKWLRKTPEGRTGDARILGSSAFVESILRQAGEQREMKVPDDAPGIDALVAAICDRLDVDESLLTAPVRQRRVARARSVISHIAFNILRLRGVDIAARLHVSPSAVSKLAVRGRREAEREEIERRLLGR